MQLARACDESRSAISLALRRLVSPTSFKGESVAPALIALTVIAISAYPIRKMLESGALAEFSSCCDS
jgi:hypothetical protein